MHVIEAIYLPQVPLFNSSPLSIESVNFIRACLLILLFRCTKIHEIKLTLKIGPNLLQSFLIFRGDVCMSFQHFRCYQIWKLVKSRNCPDWFTIVIKTWFFLKKIINFWIQIWNFGCQLVLEAFSIAFEEGNTDQLHYT